jgi:DNA integrity scanning protein DisA with diadenylate cyclase activity
MLHLKMADLNKLLVLGETKSAKEWIRTVGLPGFGDAINVQSTDAKRVAQLSAIDGAVVLNSLLSPVMFGAKFASVEIGALPEAVRGVVAKRGMRHRSMAATVALLPESSGVVVSQDGDITVFANRDGSVCCHQEEEGPSLGGNPSCRHLEEARVPRLHEALINIMKNMENNRGANDRL